MVHLYYAKCKASISDSDLEKLAFFPKAFRDKWGSIVNQTQRIQTQLSKILLVDAFKAMGLNLGDLASYYVSEMGKPDVNSGTYFSISHSDELVVVAIAGNVIGIDIQKEVNKSDAVLSRVCSSTELNFFKSKEQLWTRKEAVVKFFGDSIMNGKKYEVIKDENSACCILSFELSEGFSCAVVQKEKTSEEKIKIKFINY
jgi:phosphopantetheinyl transferase